MEVLQELHALAGEAGVQTAYRDITGRLRVASPEALLAVLRTLGIDLAGVGDASAARRALADARPLNEPVMVASDGRLSTPLRLPGTTHASARLVDESGAERSLGFTVSHGPRGGLLRVTDCVPAGVHVLHFEGGGRSLTTRIISAPMRAPSDTARTWGVFFPLHAVGRGVAGPATYQDLAHAARVLSDRGAAWVATLPILASFLDAPFEPSPYAPVSRLFWNEFFLAGSGRSDGEGPRDRYIDYRAEAAALRPGLQTAADAFFDQGGEHEPVFRAFLRERPDAVDYARFRAACDRFGIGFHGWPAEARDGQLGADDTEPAAVRRHLFAAYSAESQIAGLARTAKAGKAAALVLDLPLGVHSEGYDVWRFRSLFADGISAGAPPDQLFRGGQDWGFRPFLPDALRRTGYAHLRDVLRHHMRHAGALRVDHVMSLVRLFWIPEGFPATEGVYVSQRRDELLALLTLEATRHGTQLIGEDLGTVPAEVRAASRTHHLLGMSVLQFMLGGPDLPRLSAPVAASLNTHDTPTFCGFWQGLDIADQADLGLIDEQAAVRARADRACLRDRVRRFMGVTAAQDDEGVLQRLLVWLARGPARILIVTLEDLWNEALPQNVPGTSDERPNWRRRARFGIAEGLARPEVTEMFERIDTSRRREVRSDA